MTRKMVGGMLARPIDAELIPSAGWRVPAPRALVPHVAPEPGGFGLRRVGPHLQFNGGVVRKQGWTRPDQFADVRGQRLQQGRRAPDPVAQRGAMQIDAFACLDPGLPLKRQVIAIFADQDVRHEAGSGPPTFD